MDPPNLPLLLLLTLASTINAQNFPAPYCGSTGNFSADSTYQTTLTALLSSISTTNSLSLTYGFFKASSAVSSASQTLYVIGSCRGDLPAESCRACLNASASDVRDLSPLQKEAVLYSGNCTIRYSNASIFGTVTTDPRYSLSNVNNVTSQDTYNAALQTLLGSLQGEAAGGGSLRKYATGNESAGFDRIYATVQCTPDLTEQDCSDCLVTVVATLGQCCAGKLGVNIMAPSCQFRYETNDRFFDPVSEPLPPPPAPLSPAADAPPPPPGLEVLEGRNNIKHHLSLYNFCFKY
ncbi:cysteine-rich receptor-like protein kinase 29 [Eucalyptus grandis]|uniref:cysteine-rich receptor-like protein kinase 29 n=1 Tax=Eucalyptus grandis TaxID=71139 RepID=UPI00192EE469|nr:cysteine-rich receptor-like protein kinase 29 [Eucalyptus grandis]